MMMAERSREIFLDALEREESEREEFLRERCAADKGLRERVDKLLHAHQRSDEIFGVAPSSTPATEGTVGTRIGAFELLEVIGEGGFAIVWRAAQREPVRREVALKILKRGMDSAESVARFESERQALAMMDHPGIAKVLDGGTTENRLPWFAMELVDGLPITDFCAKEETSLKDRLRLFQELCRTVQHAHRRGVLHRDLKPSNILIAKGHEGPGVKVIDFGIAKLIDQAALFASVQTLEGHWVGTPGYMSPEQLDEHPDLDTRSDVYSLGVLLYELLCGMRPIDDETLRSASTSEVIRLIREVDPVKPSVRASARNLRGDLDWITMRCLEKDRDRRYDSVGTLALDIQNHLDGAPVLAGPPQFSYRFSKFVRRYRVPLGVAALTGLLLVAGIVSSLVQLKRARVAESELKEQVTQTEVELSKFLGISAFYESVFSSVDPEFAQGMDTELLMRVLLSASLRVERESKGQAEVEATIRRVIGGTYLSLGQFEKAEPELQRALKLRQESLGPKNRETLLSMNEYACALQQHGDSQEALPLLDEAYLGLAQVDGPESEWALQARLNLAVALKDLRKYEQAEVHFRAIEAAHLAQLGEKHEDTIRAMNNLGSTLSSLGRKSEALQRLRRAAELQLEVQGRTHLETLKSFNNLADLYSEAGRFEEALTTLEEVHAIKLEILQQGHPSLFASFNNLAMTAKETGDRERAKVLLKEGLEMADQSDTRDTRNAVVLQVNLCKFLSGDGLIDDARELHADACERAERLFGPEHPVTLQIKGGFAGFVIVKFSPDEGEALAREVLETARRVLAPMDPDLGFYALNVAEALILQDLPEEARPYLEECLQISRKAGPKSTKEKAEAFLAKIDLKAKVSEQR